MKTFARTYWFTWGFLVLAALGTGGAASVKDVFFGGLLAAVVSAALTRPYERLGLRYWEPWPVPAGSSCRCYATVGSATPMRSPLTRGSWGRRSRSTPPPSPARP
jgi:hypothetical protein